MFDIVFSAVAIKTLISFPYVSCLGLSVLISLSDSTVGLAGAQEVDLVNGSGRSYHLTGPKMPPRRGEGIG